jgi:hypothetical protein
VGIRCSSGGCAQRQDGTGERETGGLFHGKLLLTAADRLSRIVDAD